MENEEKCSKFFRTRSMFRLVISAHRYSNVSYIKFLVYYIFRRYGCLKITINGVNICINLGNLIFLPILLEQGWKISSIEESSLTMNRGDDIIIICRTAPGFDLGHLKEIYVDKSYGYDFAGKNVIDVGMSNGDSSIYFAKNGAKKVIGLEPDKRSYNLAVRNIQSSKVDNTVIALNKALAVNDGNVELIVYEYIPNANSIDTNNMVKRKGGKHKEVIDGITLKEVLDLFDDEPIDLLKMDCEGCEYGVLNNTDKEILEKIKALEMEFHNGVQNLPKILKENGFTIDVSNSNSSMGYIRAKRRIV